MLQELDWFLLIMKLMFIGLGNYLYIFERKTLTIIS